MVEVRLHGALAARFGRQWHFDIHSPAEAVRALQCARPDFNDVVEELSEKGMDFRVRSKNHDYGERELVMRLGSVKRIDIIPIVRGSSAGVRVVVGAVLVAVGYYAAGTGWGSAISPYLISAGMSLILGGIVEMLTPVQRKEEYDKNVVRSWTMDGPTNTADQGSPVPVIYGEVLAGGVTINAGLLAAQLAPGGTVTPSATITGPDTHVVNLYGGTVGPHQVVIEHSVSITGLDDPITYNWVLTGFTGYTPVITGQGTGTIQITLMVPAALGAVATEVTGQITCNVTGRDPVTSNGQTPQTGNASGVKNVTILVANVDWQI